MGLTHNRIVVSHYGGPDELRLVEEERPEPKRGEVPVHQHEHTTRLQCGHHVAHIVA